MTALLATVRAFLGQFNLLAVCVAALCLALAIQTVRLEGLSVWPVKIEGWKARAVRFEAALDLVAEAQITARAAQQAAMDAEQARYDELAERIDSDAPQTRIAVADATDRFIRDNRLRTDTQCIAGSGSAAPISGGAGSVETVPTDSLVAVSSVDVQRCSDATRYAVKAHELLMGLSIAN